MEDIEVPTAARMPPARIPQACERCRGLKTRCLPSSQPGICQRCFGASKECVWAEGPRRVRKLRAPSRIAQVEQKIDGLVARLVNPPVSNSAPNALPAEVQSEPVRSEQETWQGSRPVAPGSWMSVPISFEQNHEEPEQDGIAQTSTHAEADQQYLDKVRSIHNLGDRDGTSGETSNLFQPSKENEAPINDELVQQILSSGEADSILNEYRRMSVSFPFVILPASLSSRELYSKKPMLFLAIITMASWKDHKRQMLLDSVYRNELANRTIIRPRRTLGLVQSVLVYLSWYHFVFSHKTQQIFFLHHLLIGLALDIGLHKDYQPLRFLNKPEPAPIGPQEQRERRRAFLGCYYLASMIAAGMQKPNLLRHTSQMTDWAQSLKLDSEFQTDAAICHLISLRRIDDQVQDTLFTGAAADTSFADARTEMHVQFIETQLDAWRRDSSRSPSQRLLDLSFSFTDMVLHSVALRPQSGSDQFAMTSATVLKALLSALEAGKKFLDALLTFPANEYHTISFSEWMRLPTVIMTIAKLCMPSDAHVTAGWDVKVAQDRARLDLCLESVCYRMQGLSTFGKIYGGKKQSHPDFWYAMRFIIDLTRSWYLRKISLGNETDASAHPTPNDFESYPMSEDSFLSSDPAARRYVPATAHEHPAFGIPYMSDINVDVNIPPGAHNSNNDMFAFMKEPDFDMEQFFDLGVWGDETYFGMGFGQGNQRF